jgi:hypothetical protein
MTTVTPAATAADLLRKAEDALDGVLADCIGVLATAQSQLRLHQGEALAISLKIASDTTFAARNLFMRHMFSRLERPALSVNETPKPAPADDLDAPDREAA